jgi:hypothetical protein
MHNFKEIGKKREISLDSMNGKTGFSCHTSSGASSNSLPPMVKAILGIERTLPQSTADCPVGFGTRSQSCEIIKGISKRSISTRPKQLLGNNACITPD